MAKAIYSTKNIGHFGLSFSFYTHFTSPIRRYPDMLAHRILASHLPAPVSLRAAGPAFSPLDVRPALAWAATRRPATASLGRPGARLRVSTEVAR